MNKIVNEFRGFILYMSLSKMEIPCLALEVHRRTLLILRDQPKQSCYIHEYIQKECIQKSLHPKKMNATCVHREEHLPKCIHGKKWVQKCLTIFMWTF